MQAEYLSAANAMEEALPDVLMRIVSELHDVAYLIERIEPQLAAIHGDVPEHAFERMMVLQGIDLAVRLLHLLNLTAGQRILEGGTGSGFTAAVMGRLTERVLTVDRYRTLATNAQQSIEKAGIRNVIVRQADGSNGMPGEGTFDRILVTAAFPALPRFFAEQLVSGGMLIAPVMVGETECRMLKLVKTGSRFDREDLFDVPYLPIVPQMAQAL